MSIRVFSIVAAIGACMLHVAAADARIVKTSPAGFSIEHEVVLPLPPEEAFDAMTGDISAWWDHTFSQSPLELYIEPVPGGCFCEVFNEEGDGVEHARVTGVERGRMLRMVGPLGLAGYAFDMSMTFTYEAVAGGTRVNLQANAWGAMEDGWDKAVDSVWHHFLIEQLKPWVEAGREE